MIRVGEGGYWIVKLARARVGSGTCMDLVLD